MRFILILSLLFLFGMTACTPRASNSAANNANADSPTAKRYKIKGKVISVDRNAKTAKIEHEKIEGYMDAMTMDFPIHADWAWDDLKPGAEITGDLVVDPQAKDPVYIDKIGIMSAADPNAPAPPVNNNFAQIGQSVPDFTLTDQDSKPVSIKGFEGKALAITFIYSRCPLPDYCTRMSTNFSDLAKKIESDDALRDKLRLLSISFDPEHDTPAKLRSYGIGYMGNDPKTKFDVWRLAVGKDADVRKIADFFGLQYEVDENDKTQINHSLRTAVIGPDGKVAKIFAGNDWTPDELLEAMKGTLK